METKLNELLCVLILFVFSSSAQDRDSLSKASERFYEVKDITFGSMEKEYHTLRQNETQKVRECLSSIYSKWWRVAFNTFGTLYEKFEKYEAPSQEEIENYQTHLKTFHDVMSTCNGSQEFQTGIKSISDAGYPKLDAIFEDVKEFLGYNGKSCAVCKCSEPHFMEKAGSRFDKLNNVVSEMSSKWERLMKFEDPEVKACLDHFANGWVTLRKKTQNYLREKFKGRGPSEQELKEYKNALKFFKKLATSCNPSEKFFTEMQSMFDISYPVIDGIFNDVAKFMGYSEESNENKKTQPGENTGNKFEEMKDFLIKHVRKQYRQLREKETQMVQECLEKPFTSWFGKSVDTFESLAEEDFDEVKAYEKSVEYLRHHLKTFKDVMTGPCNPSEVFKSGIQTMADAAFPVIDTFFDKAIYFANDPVSAAIDGFSFLLGLPLLVMPKRNHTARNGENRNARKREYRNRSGRNKEARNMKTEPPPRNPKPNENQKQNNGGLLGLGLG